MSHFCLQAVEVEGFGRGGVVASAFGDVQVAGSLMAAIQVGLRDLHDQRGMPGPTTCAIPPRHRVLHKTG
jgi:hypothetical protein